MSGFFQILRGLGPIRLAVIGGVMVGVLGFFGYLMSQTSTGNQVLLFSQIDPAEGAKIMQRIESMDIPATLSPDGSAIYVPEEKVARLRMELAQEGLPGGSTVGYEIFDRGDVFSNAGSLVDINKVRALEGELAKSIRTISGVANARVHLVVPKRELFSRTSTEPSAAIVLKIKGPGRLPTPQVQAIQHLVSSAVPGLMVEKISIVDDKGNLLAKNQEGEGFIQGLTSQQEVRRSFETSTSKQLEALLEKTVGLGKVHVEVSADMDFSQSVVNTEKYDPEGQVIRSTNTTQEQGNSESSDSAVSVQNALPQDQGNTSGKSTNSNKRNDENVTYEISRTVENLKKETGTIRSLSIAVLVDGVYKKDKSGKSIYTPRTQDELDKIKKLVQMAVGFNEKRGDKVEIINMPFAQQDIGEEKPVEEQSFFPHMDLNRIIELLVLSAVGILILLMIVRPILLRIMENSGAVTGDPQLAGLLNAANTGYVYEGIPDYSSPSASSLAPSLPASNAADMPSNEDEDVEDFLDMNSVEGKVKASSLKKLSDIIDKHPEEAITIIRNWMYDEPWK